MDFLMGAELGENAKNHQKKLISELKEKSKKKKKTIFKRVIDEKKEMNNIEQQAKKKRDRMSKYYINLIENQLQQLQKMSKQPLLERDLLLEIRKTRERMEIALALPITSDEFAFWWDYEWFYFARHQNDDESVEEIPISKMTLEDENYTYPCTTCDDVFKIHVHDLFDDEDLAYCDTCDKKIKVEGRPKNQTRDNNCNGGYKRKTHKRKRIRKRKRKTKKHKRKTRKYKRKTKKHKKEIKKRNKKA
jgi:hypothetical protein